MGGTRARAGTGLSLWDQRQSGKVERRLGLEEPREAGAFGCQGRCSVRSTSSLPGWAPGMDMTFAPEKSQHIINISRYTNTSHDLPEFSGGKL